MLHSDPNPEQRLSPATSAPEGVRALLRVETSTQVYNVLYRYGRNVAAPNGAYGPNVTAPRSAWYVESQRAGATDIVAGVLRGDRSLIDEGLRMVRFALGREARNGSFPGSAWPFHGTAMFLAETAPALLVLRYSRQGSRYVRDLTRASRAFDRAARYMTQTVHGVGKIDDVSKTHRRFEAALALESVGLLAGDRMLTARSHVYALQGLSMEQPDGVMPENGGHDTGYQALGIVYALRYMELVSPSRSLYHTLYAGVQRGLAWEVSRVRADGTIDQRGDTRTAGCQERDPQGRCKTTFYAPIFNALMHWSVITGDRTLERRAYMVWLQNWRLQPGDVLPGPGLWVSPGTAHPGDWITVWGTRFHPLEHVRVQVDSMPLQTVTCDQIGSFGGHSPQPNVHVPLPDIQPGTHTITARGDQGTVRQVRIVVP